jgi:hypothetical protein
MSTHRIQHLIAAAVFVALAAAVTLMLVFILGSDAAESGPNGPKQRVAIISKGVDSDSGSGDFVLIPLQAGALTRDSGTGSAVFSKRFVMSEGQRVQITGGVETLKGQRGSLKLRFRVEWVEAGNGYHVGTGTWKIVRGTGQYAQLAGGGRRGDVWLDRGRGPWSGRAEGFLTQPS